MRTERKRGIRDGSSMFALDGEARDGIRKPEGGQMGVDASKIHAVMSSGISCRIPELKGEARIFQHVDDVMAVDLGVIP